MAGSINKVILLGHLGDDVKNHYFEGGDCIGRFPLATNEEYTNRVTGEKISNTEWHTIVVRNKLAELCEKYLSKGDRIYVEGRIKTRQWQDDAGNKRFNTEIHAVDIVFLTTKKQNSPSTQIEPTTSQSQSENIDSDKKDDDDLPF
jgi:single-strand DNA-binding protein